MNLLFLFLAIFLFGITVIECHRRRIKDGRHDHFTSFSTSSSWSSEEKNGRGKKPRGGRGHGGRGNSRPRPIPIDDYRPGPSRPRPSRPETKCPNDWLTFERKQGRWCVQLFVGLLTQPAAEDQCKAMGATLTGLQTDEERRRLGDAGREILMKYNYGDASIWLGARRKESCSTAGICAPRETFFWTDNHTKGTDGFGFSTGQPDGVTTADWGVQSCVHQFIFPSGTTHPRWPGIMHGQLDDLHCQEGRVNPTTKLYACGKKAT